MPLALSPLTNAVRGSSLSISASTAKTPSVSAYFVTHTFFVSLAIVRCTLLPNMVVVQRIRHARNYTSNPRAGAHLGLLRYDRPCAQERLPRHSCHASICRVYRHLRESAQQAMTSAPCSAGPIVAFCRGF